MDKFFIICILITVIALGYVHQQVELLKVGYLIYRNNDRMDQLLDVNGILSYNVVKNKLPHTVYSRLLASGEDFQLAHAQEVVNVCPQPAGERLAYYDGQRSRLDMLVYLGIASEAEALTVGDQAN